MKINLNECYRNQSRSIRFILAIILFLTALQLRLLLLPVDAGLSFLTFYPASVLGFYLCGTGPGALLVILSAITGFYIFTPPYWGFSHHPQSEIATTTYLISTLLIGLIVHRMQNSADQARDTLAALEISEQRYQSLLENQTEIICRFDKNGVLLYVNDAFCRFFSKSRAALLGEKWHPEVYPEDLSFVLQKLNTLSPEHSVVTVENRVVGADGNIRWGQFVNKAFYDLDGCLTEMQSVGRDITEQKKTQEAMDSLNKLINHISTRVPAAIFQYQQRSDGSSCVPFVSEAFQNLFHLSPKEVKENAAPAFALVHPEDYEGLNASINQSASTLEPWQKEFRVRFPDGNVRWLYGDALPERGMDGSTFWYGFMTDISERKETEQTLRTLSVAVEQCPAIVFIADTNANVQYVNGQFTKTTGYSKQEVIGKNPRILQSGLTPAKTHQALWDTLKQGQIWHGEMINKKKNGENYWEESHIAPTFNDQGIITHYVGVKLDITERKNTQNALRESQELFSKVFHSSPIGIAISRASDNKLIDVNDAFLGIFGYSRDEIIGKSSIDLGLWHDIDFHKKIIEKLKKQGSIQNFEVECRRKLNTSLSTLLASIHPIDVSGEPCLLEMLIDITERKLIEKQLVTSTDEIQDLYDHSPCGYHSIDRNGIILRINQTELDWLGYTREEIIGKRAITDFITASSQEIFKKSFPKFIMDGHIENLEFELVAKNGDIKPVSVAATAIRDADGNFMMSRTVLYDISELKSTQEALISMDQRKDEFLAMLAHELRNPLAPIRNTVQFLKMQNTQDPILNQSFGIIDRQVTQISRLLDDLLDVARVMQGKMTLDIKPILLDDIVAIAVETSQPMMSSKRQKLIISLPKPPRWINGDSVRLTQVISNLLNNATKYTGDEGEISLSAMSEGSDLIIQVKDNGIGIAPELLPNVFDLFIQANQGLAHSQGGIGVGLTLVHRLVELHGGTVTVESSGIGHGSLFTIRLPVLALDSTSSDTLPVDSELPKNHLRMMIVEDYASAAESLALVLKLEGHKVEIADCGKKAIEIARTFHPEVTLVDIGLPDMDGFEVAKRLRDLPQIQHNMIIALTGYGQNKLREHEGVSVFDHYMLKPVEFKKLFDLLATKI